MSLKRLAVLFAGMPRFYSESSSFVLDFFKTQDYEVDFFIHSWTNCWLNKYRQKEDLVLNHDKKQLEDSLCKIYNPKKIKVEDQLECETLINSHDLYKKAILYTDENFQGFKARNKWREKLDNQQHFLNNINAGQLYSIAEASRLRSEYEQENDFKYDLVLRYRLDNLQKEGVKLEDQIQGVYKSITDIHNPYPHNPVNCKKVLSVNWLSIKKNQLHVGDRIFISDSEGFDNFNNLLGFQMTRLMEYISTKSKDDPDHFFSCPEACMGSLVQRTGMMASASLNCEIINYRESFQGLVDQSWNNLNEKWHNDKLFL